MLPKILLVNPPIYDFAAYDFWIKPYGLLSVAGQLRSRADFALFDYLDTLHPFVAAREELQPDEFGRGRFYLTRIPNPKPLAHIPRFFRRFGLPRDLFIAFLANNPPADFVFIQTMMTWWYPALAEVIEDLRRFYPSAKIILGGNYATLCPDHAKSLGPDLIIQGRDLAPLWKYLNLTPDPILPALWEIYDKLSIGVLKLTEGCPFNCTYCSVPAVYREFKPRPAQRCLVELDLLHKLGVKQIAFYDDALLFAADKILVPFLNYVLAQNIKVNFHTPNAINARFLTKDLAALMVRAGFKTFYLGFESVSLEWQKQTGSKVYSEELAQAVSFLKAAGADPRNITAYQILGHPRGNTQELVTSMRFVNSLGIRGMLADFSPIPGTPDGDFCAKWVDLSEPLLHSKTAFPIILLGNSEVNRLKDLQRTLNRSLSRS